MSKLQAIGRARMHLAQAITRSCAGERDAVVEHMTTAAECLRHADLSPTADLVEDLRDEDCRRCDFRYDLRQITQLLDAWASPNLDQIVDEQLEADS